MFFATPNKWGLCSPSRSNHLQPLHHIGKLRHHVDRQRGLGVELDAALFPVSQRHCAGFMVAGVCQLAS